MKGPGSAEGTFGVRLLSAIAADESWIFRYFFNYRGFSSRCQFTQMHRVVIWIGAQIVDVDQSITHSVVLFCFCEKLKTSCISIPEDSEDSKS